MSLGTTYTIQRELGGGGMSHVFVAEDMSLGRMVVIKLLSPHLAGELSAERFAREIRVAARLQHPHIVPLFSAGVVDGMPYYTMPFIEGESLRSRLVRDGALKPAEASWILRDIARALDYAHAHDVIHRDIKPDNVLLSGSSACVTDFGIAKAVSAARTDAVPERDPAGTALTRQGMALGTPAYMAPEQASCEPDLDHRVDIYAFGCLAFELLTGRPPFYNREPQALLIAQIMETPPLTRLRRPEIPRSLADLITSCLAKSADDRPQSAADLVSAIETTNPRAPYSSGNTEIAPSIAVLPFENMSADPENEFFSDGITEEIINSLTQLNGLRVAGRTSSFAFKGRKQDLSTIGEKLNVGTILEGSVRKSGNRLRITAQLIKVSDGYHLWSERFDRELTDVFAVQDEIATAIASKLKLTLGDSGELVKPLTHSIEAYELFLKGRLLYSRLGRQILTAIDCFTRAVELDDCFGLAHAALADSLTLSAYYGLVRPQEVMERAHAAALSGVKFAPENSEARHALAFWMTLYGGDRHAAMTEWERSIAVVAPTTQVRCSYAVFGLGLLGRRWDEAVREIDAAVAADPLNGHAHTMMSAAKTFAGQLDRIVADARMGVELDPDRFWAHLSLQRAYHHAGMHEQAQTQGHVTLAMSGRHPWAMAELAVEYASVGNRDAADAIYGELVSRSRFEFLQPSAMALAAVAAGRIDEAIELCYRAIDERDGHILWAVSGRWKGWEPIYEDPRWREVRNGIISWRPRAVSRKKSPVADVV